MESWHARKVVWHSHKRKTTFLVDRKLRVLVGNSFSSPEDQLEGVPHRSVLSVTLFAIVTS